MQDAAEFDVEASERRARPVFGEAADADDASGRKDLGRAAQRSITRLHERGALGHGELVRGPVAAGLFAAILFFAYSYSGPPLRLGCYGLGEVTAAGVMAVMAPIAGAATAGGFTRALWPLVAILRPPDP